MAEARSPAATVDTIDEAAVSKSALPNSRLFVMSVLGGMFIAVGALLAIVVAGGSTELVANNPGLARLVMGVVFPVGFIAVMLTGAGLFTSDCATQMVPWYRRRVSGSTVLRVLIVAYLANVVGAVGLAFLGWSSGILGPDQPWTPYLLALADGKVSHSWVEVFSKGILANMLVCVAAWQAYSSRSTTGKILGIWFPVMAFVALGHRAQHREPLLHPSGDAQRCGHHCRAVRDCQPDPGDPGQLGGRGIADRPAVRVAVLSAPNGAGHQHLRVSPNCD